MILLVSKTAIAAMEKHMLHVQIMIYPWLHGSHTQTGPSQSGQNDS